MTDSPASTYNLDTILTEASQQFVVSILTTRRIKDVSTRAVIANEVLTLFCILQQIDQALLTDAVQQVVVTKEQRIGLRLSELRHRIELITLKQGLSR